MAVGQEVPPALIELGGTLAPACKLEVRNAPVEVTRRGPRAEVRLDTSRAARVDGEIEVVGPGGGEVVRVLARIGAHVGSGSAAGIGIETAPWMRAEAAAGTRPPTGAEAAGEAASRTDAEIGFDTDAATDADVAVGWAPQAEGLHAVESASWADEWARGPGAAQQPTLAADPGRPRRRFSRDSSLLIATWVVTAATALAGLVHGGCTGQNWYDHLLPNLSPLSVIATPLALVGLQLAGSARTRMVTAIAVTATGAVSAGIAGILMVYGGVILQELTVELIGASLVAVLGSVMAVRVGREVSWRPAHAAMVTTVLMGALAAFSVVPTVRAVTSGLLIYPLVIGVCAVLVLLAIGLLLPLQARGRVVLGAVLVGLLLTVTLYTLTPRTLGDAILLPVWCVGYSVLAIFHVRPFWRALQDRAF